MQFRFVSLILVDRVAADMSNAVDRHIIEKRWREEGRLDELVGVDCSGPSLSIISHPLSTDGTHPPDVYRA
ncbi:hypothetical protein PISMIDRAFT_270492 [Pisolithus microcarpus 441]|uniref:Uncharacterized protein n=1 Tax=Pisolithus microcarpus 441 TaxID=765257 RepID=A0A0C9Z1N1_9AGAM|nr:hypothetical protein PISMIDRAFT_270492 [Pisolithus microcarpus 441]